MRVPARAVSTAEGARELKGMCAALIDGESCSQPATHHAPHEHADWYCDQHQTCPRCKASIDKFRLYKAAGVWLCPCVIASYRTLNPRRRGERIADEEYIEEVVEKKKWFEAWNKALY